MKKAIYLEIRKRKGAKFWSLIAIDSWENGLDAADIQIVQIFSPASELAVMESTGVKTSIRAKKWSGVKRGSHVGHPEDPSTSLDSGAQIHFQ